MSRKLQKYAYQGADRKALQAMLRDKGFYSTEGRLELLALLKSAREPMPVPMIARRLGRQLDEVSVYRALEALAEKFILVRSDVRRGGAHYEFPHGHHHHLVCNSCGRTEDIEDCDDKKLEARVLKRSRSFARINTHSLEFFGVCDPCAKRRI